MTSGSCRYERGTRVAQALLDETRQALGYVVRRLVLSGLGGHDTFHRSQKKSSDREMIAVVIILAPSLATRPQVKCDRKQPMGNQETGDSDSPVFRPLIGAMVPALDAPIPGRRCRSSAKTVWLVASHPEGTRRVHESLRFVSCNLTHHSPTGCMLTCIVERS